MRLIRGKSRQRQEIRGPRAAGRAFVNDDAVLIGKPASIGTRPEAAGNVSHIGSL